jgi:FMN phosphatase YigB (HAD superfamily)
MNPKPSIQAVILDFDNTLFDWFQFWYHSFRGLLDEIIRISELPEEVLLPEIKKVHEKYGTSEYSFLLEELDILKNKLEEGVDVTEVYKDAILRYREERQKYLRLYSGVFETLLHFKKEGVKIIVYTESQDYYSKMRMKQLRLDGVVDLLFSPEEQKDPEINTEEKRSQKNGYYDMQITELRRLEKGHKKPDREALLDIIRSCGLDKNKCIYLGNNLTKDILMANEAGVTSLYAASSFFNSKKIVKK